MIQNLINKAQTNLVCISGDPSSRIVHVCGTNMAQDNLAEETGCGLVNPSKDFSNSFYFENHRSIIVITVAPISATRVQVVFSCICISVKCMASYYALYINEKNTDTHCTTPFVFCIL